MTLYEAKQKIKELEQKINKIDQRLRTLRHEALNPQYRKKVIMTRRDTYKIRREKGLCVKCGNPALKNKEGKPMALCKVHYKLKRG